MGKTVVVKFKDGKVVDKAKDPSQRQLERDVGEAFLRIPGEPIVTPSPELDAESSSVARALLRMYGRRR